jgi:hypothetical protein
MRMRRLLPWPEGSFPSPARPDLRPEDRGRRPATAIGQARPTPAVPDRDVLYAQEAIRLLGLDRLARPENALQRLIEKGDLPRKKIGGRLVFEHAALERLKQHGSRRSRRGRPPGSRNRHHHGTPGAALE